MPEPRIHPHVFVGDWFLLKLFVLFMDLLTLLESLGITIFRIFFTTRKKLADHMVCFYHHFMDWELSPRKASAQSDPEIL